MARPQHSVTISKPFYLGKYEVTQAEWVAVMGRNPSYFNAPNNPVEHVSWDDAQKFIRRLNAREGHARYRLPTEAEWEYAARGGTSTRFFFGDNEGALGQYAWYWDNAGTKTAPVGQKQPNQYGLYDIYGNVWEWVQDWLGEYPKTAVTDPKGPAMAPPAFFAAAVMTASPRTATPATDSTVGWTTGSASLGFAWPSPRSEGQGQSRLKKSGSIFEKRWYYCWYKIIFKIF